MTVKPAIIPCLTYRDAPAAIAFLCDAFGFARHAVHADPDNPSIVHHAQLVREGQMIMLSSDGGESEFQRKARMLHPADAKGVTQTLYVVTNDVDAHAARATAAGAEILLAPTDQDYGGRNYSARDPEGYVWSFGDYDPFAETA